MCLFTCNCCTLVVSNCYISALLICCICSQLLSHMTVCSLFHSTICLACNFNYSVPLCILYIINLACHSIKICTPVQDEPKIHSCFKRLYSKTSLSCPSLSHQTRLSPHERPGRISRHEFYLDKSPPLPLALGMTYTSLAPCNLTSLCRHFRPIGFFFGWSVVRRLTLDIAYNHTKFDDCMFQRYFRDCEIIECITWP